jgi:DNA transposition AAA+ family ATPase
MSAVKNTATGSNPQISPEKLKQYDQSLIDELEKLQTETNKTWIFISKQVGVNDSIINQWRQKKYPGDIIKVNDAVEKYLRVERQKINSKVDLDFVPIGNSRKILRLLNKCHADGVIGAIIGDTGTSKSVTLRKYMEENNVIYIHANRTFRWPVEYLRKIHIHPRIGKSGIGTLNKLANEIIDALAGKNILIIIDQADYLNLAAIDIFRTINEDAGVGVVFCGLPSFLSRLQGNQPEVRQVRDRIKMKLVLKPYSFDECKLILDLNYPGINGLSKVFYDLSNGSLRILSGLVYNTRMIMQSPKYKGLQMDEQVIRDASLLLERRIIQ